MKWDTFYIKNISWKFGTRTQNWKRISNSHKIKPIRLFFPSSLHIYFKWVPLINFCWSKQSQGRKWRKPLNAPESDWLTKIGICNFCISVKTSREQFFNLIWISGLLGKIHSIGGESYILDVKKYGFESDSSLKNVFDKLLNSVQDLKQDENGLNFPLGPIDKIFQTAEKQRLKLGAMTKGISI